MTTRSLDGRVVVILGGAGGIGAATAVAAAKTGACVVVADVRALPATVAGISFEWVDVTDFDSLTQLRGRVLERFGQVDAVINCAAIIEPGGFDRISVDAIRRQFEVNALGAVFATKVFLPEFLSRSNGHFIHLSSLGGIVPLPDEAVYSATKFAVRGFCLAMAQELKGSGVAVTVLCPDSTATQQLEGEAQLGGAALSFVSHPLRPADVADVILDVLLRPRREVCVPGRRALFAKCVGAFPGFFKLAYPTLAAIGNRSRARFLIGSLAPGTCRDGAGAEVGP